MGREFAPPPPSPEPTSVIVERTRHQTERRGSPLWDFAPIALEVSNVSSPKLEVGVALTGCGNMYWALNDKRDTRYETRDTMQAYRYRNEGRTRCHFWNPCMLKGSHPTYLI